MAQERSGESLVVVLSIVLVNYNRAVPTIVVFTKYDELVTTVIGAGGDAIAQLQDEEIWQYGAVNAIKVITGIKLLRTTWRLITLISATPLARAVRT